MKGTLVGIYENNKGYECSILEWKKVVTFRDVTINEEKNLIHHVNVGRHEDVANESHARIKGYLLFSYWNTNCQEEQQKIDGNLSIVFLDNKTQLKLKHKNLDLKRTKIYNK
jgi:hypothetical protein